MEAYYVLGYCCIGGEITGYCAFQCKTSLKRDLRCTYRWKIYIERTYWKTQSVVFGGHPCHHRFFVRLVALIFRLTAGTFGCQHGCLCQNENMVRVVNNFIDNTATSLPNKSKFPPIKQWITISLISHPRIMVRVMLNGITERLAELDTLLSEEQK